jgi:15-cis-phytoene synthase
MAVPYPQTWEHKLLSLATGAKAPAATSTHPAADAALLERAYGYCEALTAAHSRSFHLASALLPRNKRRAMRALYAFCRVCDDLVDEGGPGAEAALAAWQRRALSAHPPVDDPVAVAWTDTRLRYRIPLRYAEQLINGVASDLQPRRYQTFDDLAAYAYGVASTVGLMSMHIIGYAGDEAVPYAIKLGVALQLTNILRDVGEDWRAGRVYLPQQDLALFGLTEADLVRGQVDDRWRAFMRYEIAWNRDLYAEAMPGIQLLNPDGRLAVQAAAEFYRAILDDIEAHDYDVFGRRAHMSKWAKLARLPGLWWRSR